MDTKAECPLLFLCTLISFLLLLATAMLPWGCSTRKQKPSAVLTTIIYADTTRTKLVHRADSSSAALTIIHQRTQSTVTPYEKSLIRYDSIRVALP